MVFPRDDQKEEIRNRVPIEDLLRDYSVQLLPAGGRRLRALCPFHREKTPSFYVDPEKQYFHCFGCKEGGDIFDFVEKMDHVAFPEALEILARRAGVTLQRGRRGEKPGEKITLHDALAHAEEYYHRLLLDDPRGDPGRKYLEKRRIQPEMWKKFRLGFSPPEWEGLFRHLLARGVAPEVQEKAGLIRARDQGGGFYDYFRGRVMFPIQDAQKRTLGFGARALGDEVPKYLNTPKTPVFEKGLVLYALPLASAAILKEGRIAVMEGYTDVIMAHQSGLDHAVASLGTAFTQENARRLRRLATRVDLVFDGDAAGQSAAERSLELLVAEDLEVRIFTVTTGKDPCDALLELGGVEFRRRIEAEAVDLFEFKWRRTVSQAEGRGEGPAGVARAMDEVLALLARVPNIVTRKLLVKRLSERLGLEEEVLEERLRKHLPRPTEGRGPPGDSRGGPQNSQQRRDPDAQSGRQLGEGRAPQFGHPQGPSEGPGGARGGSPGGAAASIAARASSPCLEEVLLECLLVEPERAVERAAELVKWHRENLEKISVGKSSIYWSNSRIHTNQEIGREANQEVIRESWIELFSSERGLLPIATAVERQVSSGALDVKALFSEIDDEASRRSLVGILARCDRAPGGARVAWDEVWKISLRELERKALERRSQALEEAKIQARSRGDETELRRLQAENLEILRRLKNPAARVSGPRRGPGSTPGRPTKGASG